ncbi:MAG: hypothetical protein IJM23_10680 [Lachnospiraceae bacterium]|nr:hypothetical protein [Lachnospiraceae bacterium]
MEQNQKVEQATGDAGASYVKHTAKDSVFTDLFGNTHYLIQLYRALHPEDTVTTEQDIFDVTINNVLTNNQYNDLGFRVGNRLLVLVEAQSTWSVNILIRTLMYLMETLNQYFTENGVDLYRSVKVEIPEPELYVIYTGDKKSVPKQISLKDEFFAGKDVAVDAKVKVLTSGESGDIITQYIVFTQVLNEQVKIHGRTRKAIEETIKICKDRNVLKDYLESRSKEVIDIMIALYDEQEVMDRYVANEKKESEIKATVDECQFFGASISDAIQRVASKFNIPSSIAESKVNQYWA